MTPPPLIIWRLIDGIPGHEKQSLGLANALARRTRVERHDISCPGRLDGLVQWMRRHFPAGSPLPEPDLLLGAGHGTHLPMLAARRARGGRVVVMMKPSLPLACFDLCLIPSHDHPPSRPNVLATRGALNDVRTSRQQDPGRGLILVGGPSRHYGWHDSAVLEQLQRLLTQAPGIRWTLTTSRRTPAGFAGQAANTLSGQLEVRPHDETPPGWLESALAEAGQAWVTEDSVSMLHEALTAGCRVGLLRLPSKGASRVARGVTTLLEEGWLSTLDAPAMSANPADRPPFNESERCAHWILNTWFKTKN